MGLEEKLPSGILLTTVEGLAGYARRNSMWPATFGLACCAIEMMATGGFVVAVPNGGNAEFLRDGLNCLLYDRGDIDAAVSCINRIVNDHGLRKTLYDGGLKTAEERDWSKLTDRVVRLYD